ncbi:T9SS type A sorting domain-containing protein [candidate division KSB1 bacterium]|nr:T9SS type A sorting domain-containing protein [candidate division KSB1 bacterium]
MKTNTMKFGMILAIGIMMLFAHTAFCSVSLFCGFGFDDGTTQGWTAYGPLDEDGDGPFSTNLGFSWSDVANYPTTGLIDPVGDDQGSLKICCAGGHGITNPTADYWVMYFMSPDLSSSGAWQNTDGYSIKLYNGMELIGPAPGEHLQLYVNLYVTVYDHDEMRDRYFCCFSSAQEIDNYFVTNEWISFTYDWADMIATVANYTVKEIYIGIWGNMDDYFEGGLYLDEVRVTKMYAVPVLNLSLADILDKILHRGESSTQVLSIGNSGDGNLIYKITAVSADCSNGQSPKPVRWGSVEPARGVVEPGEKQDVTITFDAKNLLPNTYNVKIIIQTNDPQNRVTEIPVQMEVKQRFRPNINPKPQFSYMDSTLTCDTSQIISNYPNPFNPSTTILFNLAQPEFVSMKIYNIRGQEIETLIEKNCIAGEHHVIWHANGLPSGMYLATIRAGEKFQTRKLILKK